MSTNSTNHFYTFLNIVIKMIIFYNFTVTINLINMIMIVMYCFTILHCLSNQFTHCHKLNEYFCKNIKYFSLFAIIILFFQISFVLCFVISFYHCLYLQNSKFPFCGAVITSHPHVIDAC